LKHKTKTTWISSRVQRFWRSVGMPLVVLLLIGCVSIAGSATLRIETFWVDLEVLESGQLEITETLDVRFFSAHHGIYRQIPVSYRRPTGENLSIGLTLNEVSMDGAQVPYTSRRSGRLRVIRIGDPDRTIVGTHTYTISYRVDRALLFGNEEYIQLYWNATGNDWEIPIDRAVARVSLPASVDNLDLPTTSYVGYAGSTSRGGVAVRDAEGRYVFEATALAPGEGLTIDLAIPREVSGILPPRWTEKVFQFVRANVYALLPILTLAFMLFWWWRKGKDPAKGVIAPRYDVPKGVHAGEAGTLIDDRIDLQDITAMVIGLAVKGYLTIQEIDEPDEEPAKRKRSSEPLDFEFAKRRDADEELTPVERLLLDSIFDEEHDETRTLSSLENAFYKVLPNLRARLYKQLIDKGYYASSPEGVRSRYVNLAIACLFAAVAAGFWLSSLYLAVALGVSGLIVLAFSRIMPRKTEKGMAALREILGLEIYIRKAELRRVEFHNAPEKTPQRFERMLPYAIALNLTKIWTEQFEDTLTQPPNWYGAASGSFHPHWFGLRMALLSRGMQRTFVSAPRSSGGRSAWSGSSSFGGGFSGGGFGGGGGGGW
jgi:uncharacterized membrane protein YgcG